MEQGKTDWQSLLEQGVRLKIIGDSIGAGSGTSDDNRSGPVFFHMEGKVYKRQLGKKGWAARLAAYVETCFPRSRVINNSCSRIDSTQVLACLDQLVEEDDDLVLLEVGTNDRKREDGAKCLTENLRKLIRILQERGKRVILMCPNPSTATNEAQANRFFHMDQVNAIMAEAAEEAGILFVSQYEYILGELTREGRDLETLMMDGVGVHDGLHPPDRVHEMMFDHLLEALKLPPACEIINIHG